MQTELDKFPGLGSVWSGTNEQVIEFDPHAM